MPALDTFRRLFGLPHPDHGPAVLPTPGQPDSTMRAGQASPPLPAPQIRPVSTWRVRLATFLLRTAPCPVGWDAHGRRLLYRSPDGYWRELAVAQPTTPPAPPDDIAGSQARAASPPGGRRREGGGLDDDMEPSPTLPYWS